MERVLAYVMVTAAVVVLTVVVFVSRNDPSGDAWPKCADAVANRIGGVPNFASSEISWSDGVDGTRVASGTVEDGVGDRFRFECGVNDAGNVAWVDLT